jgi:FtsH-binding integral membrane protein
MKLTFRRPSLAAATATWVALGLLAVLVFASCAALIPLSESTATEYPEFEDLRVPLLTLALAVGVCVEVILVSTAVLVRFIRRDRIFNQAAVRLVNVLVISVLVATILIGLTLAFIPGPPLLAIAIVAIVLAGITLFFVLLVLKSLLQRTALMRTELDEVV